MNRISVVVIDDHRLIREMWTNLFAIKKEIEVIGAAGTFDDAIQLVKEKKPAIVLLDINLPPASGLDAVPLIRKYSPGTKIIAVSMHTEPVYAKKMIGLGAKGYVTKNSSHLEVFNAIDEVMAGNIFICTEMKNIMTEQLLGNDDNEPGIKTLSLREIEIIKLIKDGLSSKDISLRLYISARTVAVHRQNILKKLKLKNTVALINFISTNDPQF